MATDDYIRDLEQMFSETEAKAARAKELKGEWLRGQFDALRKAIKMTPREFRQRFEKDPKGTFQLMKARYERISKRVALPS